MKCLNGWTVCNFSRRINSTSSNDRKAPSTARLRNTRAPVGPDEAWCVAATEFSYPGGVATLRLLPGRWGPCESLIFLCGRGHGVTPIVQPGVPSGLHEMRVAHTASGVADPVPRAVRG